MRNMAGQYNYMGNMAGAAICVLNSLLVAEVRLATALQPAYMQMKVSSALLRLPVR